MTTNLVDKGDRDGFQQGWDDGINSKICQPRPALVFGFFDAGYLRSYQAAYNDGFETAKSELARRELFLQRREAIAPEPPSREEI